MIKSFTQQFFFTEFSRMGGGRIFSSDLDYKYYLKLLKAHLDRSLVEIYAFVLLPYSICAVVSAGNGKEILHFFQDVNNGFCGFCQVRDSSKTWNISRSMVIVLDLDEVEKWIECIDELPVSKGLCERKEFYSWGSGRARVNGQRGNGYVLTEKNISVVIHQQRDIEKQRPIRRD